MFNVGWSEILLILVVALIFIGPKELPDLLFKLGRLVRRARAFGASLQNQASSLMRESEIEDIDRKFREFVNNPIPYEAYQLKVEDFEGDKTIATKSEEKAKNEA